MAFRPIPGRCPQCRAVDEWKEVINPFTSGIPISENVRLHIFSTRGFGLHVKYRCRKCGLTDKYSLKDKCPDLRNMQH